MKIVVGLGNPGLKYETTRHNVGFLAADRLVDAWSARQLSIKYEAELFEATVGGEKLLIVKPQTFMNLSGRTVGPIVQFHKCKPEDVIVIYDEFDLPPASFKIKVGGGSGGHNGLKSLDEHLGAEMNGYIRVRLGIGHPRNFEDDRRHMDPSSYVLGQFTDEELEKLDPVLDDVTRAVELVIQGKLSEAMNRYNRKESREEG